MLTFRYAFALLVCLGLLATTITAQETADVTVADDLTELSDEFDDPETLDNWLLLSESEGWIDMFKSVDIDTTNEGHLTVEPDASGWFEEWHGGFLYKEVTGDFIVTARLWSKGKETDTANQTWSLSGLMARVQREDTPETWQPGLENWLFITTGIADNLSRPVFETKTTIDSSSKLKLHPTKAGWVELGLVRIGPNFVLLARYEGEDWKIKARFTREDMPETLQVGLNAYSDGDSRTTDSPVIFNTVPTEGKPDLVVMVDYIRFQRPNLPADFDVTKVRSMGERALITALFGE